MNNEQAKLKQEELENTEACELSQEEAKQTDAQSVLEQELAEQKNLAQDLQNRFLRLQADYDNYRKRTLREKEEIGIVAEANLAKSLLPVLDNFDRAFANMPEEAIAWGEGVQLVQRQLIDLLSNAGLEYIECLGKQFDPTVHEAVMREESTEAADGSILQELQKGYLYRGKLLRPSMVKVASNS